MPAMETTSPGAAAARSFVNAAGGVRAAPGHAVRAFLGVEPAGHALASAASVPPSAITVASGSGLPSADGEARESRTAAS